MVYLQTPPTVSLAPFSRLCRSAVARWYRACPYFSLRDELKTLIGYRQLRAAADGSARNTILISDKRVTLIAPDGTIRPFWHKLWRTEIHYPTDGRSSYGPLQEPVCTLRLINRQRVITESFACSPDRIEAAVRLCLSKKIVIREFRNGQRVHLGKPLTKKERRAFNSRYKTTF